MKKSLTLLLAAVLATGISGSTALASTGYYETGVTFYQDCDYLGAHTGLFYEGDYNLASLEARGFQNDWASSVRIPEGYTVQLFADDGLYNSQLNQDQWVLVQMDSSSSNFANLAGGNGNDTITSVRVRHGVTFYEHAGYNGKCTSGLEPGSYTRQDLERNGFVNDWVSSVSIPKGWTVELYEDDNFSGRVWTLNQMDYNSTDFANFNGNDTISSVRIYK